MPHRLPQAMAMQHRKGAKSVPGWRNDAKNAPDFARSGAWQRRNSRPRNQPIPCRPPFEGGRRWLTLSPRTAVWNVSEGKFMLRVMIRMDWPWRVDVGQPRPRHTEDRRQCSIGL